MKKFLKSDIVTVIITLIIFFLVFSFVYPFFVKPKAKVAKTDIYMTPPVSVPHNDSIVKKIIDNKLVASAVQVFEKSPIVFYGTSNSNFIDPKKFPDGPGLNDLIRNLGNSSSQDTRNFNVTSFSAKKSGFWVYFAWPTSYENGGVHSCKSISFHYEIQSGNVDCFSGGGNPDYLFVITDSFHRTIPDFVDANGSTTSYEIYRTHNPIDAGTSVYFSVF